MIGLANPVRALRTGHWTILEEGGRRETPQAAGAATAPVTFVPTESAAARSRRDDWRQRCPIEATHLGRQELRTLPGEPIALKCITIYVM